MQWEVKKEPQSNFFGSHFDPSSSCSKAGLMSVSLTLNRAAAEVPFMFFFFLIIRVFTQSAAAHSEGVRCVSVLCNTSCVQITAVYALKRIRP